MTLQTAAAKFALNAINKFISGEHLASVEIVDLHIAAGKLSDAIAAEQAQAANSRIGFLYEELRKAIDGGSESMTHDDALKQIAYWQDKEQAQAVEPATGERADLIAALRECHGKRLVISPSMFSKAADMLESDAQEIERTLKMYEKAHQGRADFRQAFREARKAQQVAVPALKIKPFTQRLRDNREADYSLDALMPPTRKEIESAMNEEILELRDALAKAQQVAVPVPMSDSQISDAWESIHPSKEYPVTRLGRHFARAIEKHHGIGAKP